MFALYTVLGDGVVIDIGKFHMVLGLGLLIYLAIAAIVGLVAEAIVGWRLPFGFIGAIIAALLGIWLLTSVVHLILPFEINVFGVPIFTALIGAIILVALWHAVTFRSWSRRRRYA